MVILGIIVGTLLPGYNNFSSRIALRRVAQEVALSIREAQSYAFAVRGFDPPGGGTQLVYTAWGVNFDTTVSTNSYRMFVDHTDGDSLYDVGELVSTIPLTGGIKIVELAARLESGLVGDDVHNLTSLNIVYRRPNPSTTLTGGGVVYPSDLEIILENSKGVRATVVVWQSGQVSVK
jgi:hypothetical protein